VVSWTDSPLRHKQTGLIRCVFSKIGLHPNSSGSVLASLDDIITAAKADWADLGEHVNP
jgi:hypothetical protein